MPRSDPATSEDEDWSPGADEEAIPGFEHLHQVSVVELSEGEDAMTEFFLANDPTNDTTVLIKVDHEAEESVELNGSDCDLFRTKLCSQKGIDATMDKETATAVWLAEVGKVPTALEVFDKAAGDKAGKKKKIVESEDEDGFVEVHDSSEAVAKVATKKALPKKKAALPKKRQSKLKAASPEKKCDEAKVVATSTKKGDKKKAEVKEPAKECTKTLPKEEIKVKACPQTACTKETKIVVATPDEEKKAPAKKKAAPKRKRAEETIVDFIAKKEKITKEPSDDVGWQLILNGKTLQSLHSAISSLSH